MDILWGRERYNQLIRFLPYEWISLKASEGLCSANYYHASYHTSYHTREIRDTRETQSKMET